METKLCPLSSCDSFGVGQLVLTVGTLLAAPGADPNAVESALSRLTLKWRLLVGRVEWNYDRGGWDIRVPTSEELPESYTRYSFTSVLFATPAPLKIPSLTPTIATLCSAPDVSYFRSPYTPISVGQYAKRAAPLVSIHVSTWTNCQAIGISVTHGIFDAIGLGLIIQALDAELHNREWPIPPLSSTNLLEQARHAAGKVPLTSSAPDRALYTRSAKRPWDMVRFVWGTFRERFWQRCTRGDVFLGREIVEKMVRETKEAVRRETGGEEWVSTGDVLAAWLIKAMFPLETSSSDILLGGTLYDFRPVLSPPPTSSLVNHPHNAFNAIFLPLMPLGSLPSTSLSTLALLHRRSLTAQRHLPSLLDGLNWQEAVSLIPSSRNGTVGLNISNQVRAGLTKVDWGAPRTGWWEWGLEDAMDHTATWNEVGEGWVMSVMTRPVRWSAIELELKRLEKKGR